MKTQLALITALAILSSGCGLLKWTERTDVERMQNLARVTAFTASAIYMDQHPESLKAFILVRNSIDALLLGAMVDPLALRECLAQLPMEELRADRVAILITTAVLMLEEVGVASPVEAGAEARAIAVGIRDGIHLAIRLHEKPS